ncbi:MAG: lipopolysaccharide biosynthesis protein [Xanthomonadales bacterium]|nr:lipopolysaccharide biosynthesis protein [Xanthomonadales bacterium]
MSTPDPNPDASNTVGAAVRWKVIDQALTQGLALISAIVLARLLLPADFGLFVMVVVFIALAELFVHVGVASALIQRQDTTATDENTVFWFNLAIGIVLAVGVFLAAPAIAAFYDQPLVADLTRAMSVNVVLSALVTVPAARWRKALDFRRLATMAGISTGGGMVVAIVMALNGAGAWALAGQILATGALRCVSAFALDRWRPGLEFNAARFRTLFGYGSWLALAQAMTLLASQAYTVVVGRLYTPADLGIFNRAINTSGLPQTFISNVYLSVAFPVLSRHSADPARMKRALSEGLVAAAAIHLPVMVGIALVAENLVPVAFGPNWDAVAPFLQVLCLASIPWLVFKAQGNALKALGLASLYFRLQLVFQGLFIVMVLVTAPVGLDALAWGMFAMQLLGFVLFGVVLGRYLDFGLAAQLQELAPLLALAAFMAVVVLGQRQWVELDSNIANLLLSTVVGMVAYLVPLALFRPSMLRQLLRPFKG